MKPLKVMTVVGTRPEIIRLSRVIAALDEAPSIDHVLVHTGQNYDYELNEIFFEDLGLRAPDRFLEAAAPTPAGTVGQLLVRIDPLLAEEAPDAFLVLGDTNSCLSAICAKKRRIPIFHMEAGNRCFDQRVPEETNRRIVDHIADINLTYSDIAREYLLAEGMPADRVIKTGSPMYEVLDHYRPRIDGSDVLERLGLEREGYYLVSSHREENLESDRNFTGLVGILRSLADDRPVIVSTHPRTRGMIEARGVEFDERVRLLKPLCFSDYVRLQTDALAVLSDSGTISEESSILNFPALNLREAHERPEAMEEASVMMVGMSVERVWRALGVLRRQGRGQTRTLRLVGDYASPN
ncbi:MAG: non-hydrolyzing UDP-N-acetylglucosamine 2-epimerase, partial [Gemmatimonadota bacterium]